MPLYEYKCSECNDTFTVSSSIDDRKKVLDDPCKVCGNSGIIQKLSFGGIADPIRLGRIKPPDGFNEVLRNIKKGNAGSNINIRD